MAIDYLLGAGCPPQRELGAEWLVSLHRTRIQARAALAHYRASGDTREPHELSIQMHTTTAVNADAGEARTVTLADLLAESAPLDAVVGACASCPAGMPRELACHGRIRYPIAERTEAWLMARLPESLGTTAGILLVRGLEELGWDGAPAAKARAAGFYESRVPYGVRWEADGKRIELSADQIFHMMFMVGPLAPTHCMMLALFLGVLPHDTPLTDLKDAESRRRALAATHVAVEPDEEIEQLAAFLRMLAVAARLDVPILVDG